MLKLIYPHEFRLTRKQVEYGYEKNNMLVRHFICATKATVTFENVFHIDEVWMDGLLLNLAASRTYDGEWEEIKHKIKREVFDETGHFKRRYTNF